MRCLLGVTALVRVFVVFTPQTLTTLPEQHCGINKCNDNGVWLHSPHVHQIQLGINNCSSGVVDTSLDALADNNQTPHWNDNGSKSLVVLVKQNNLKNGSFGAVFKQFFF